jgi:hypothetical protein
VKKSIIHTCQSASGENRHGMMIPIRNTGTDSHRSSRRWTKRALASINIQVTCIAVHNSSSSSSYICSIIPHTVLIPILHSRYTYRTLSILFWLHRKPIQPLQPSQSPYLPLHLHSKIHLSTPLLHSSFQEPPTSP